MTPDQYIRNLLDKKYAVPPGHKEEVDRVARDLHTYIQTWAGPHLAKVQYSGSFAKGTMVRGGTDVDLFISLKPSMGGSLEDIYHGLLKFLTAHGLQPRRQNVSIGLRHNGLNVDLVPARRHSGTGQDHSLFRRKDRSWTKTNIQMHIQRVRDSGRIAEIRATKIWKKVHGLDFPSFYLELAVIRALRRRAIASIEGRLLRVFEWLSSEVETAAIVDPANGTNVISDDLTANEKGAIAYRADWSLRQQSWDRVIW